MQFFFHKLHSAGMLFSLQMASGPHFYQSYARTKTQETGPADTVMA